MNRDELLKQVTVLNFMALDLHLYLNTHPHDAEALAMYNDVVANGAKARCQYTDTYGPLSFGDKGAAGWPWADECWPWHSGFNFPMNCACAASKPAPPVAVPLPGVKPSEWLEPYGEELL